MALNYSRPIILLDSNFLMSLSQTNIYLTQALEILFGTYDLIIPSFVLDELEGLKRKGGKRGIQARFAIKLANHIAKELLVPCDPSLSVDECLIQLAKQFEGSLVATNDQALRQLLRSYYIKSIFIRGNQKLDVS